MSVNFGSDRKPEPPPRPKPSATEELQEGGHCALVALAVGLVLFLATWGVL